MNQFIDFRLKLQYKTTWLYLLSNVMMYVNNDLVTFTYSLRSNIETVKRKM